MQTPRSPSFRTFDPEPYDMTSFRSERSTSLRRLFSWTRKLPWQNNLGRHMILALTHLSRQPFISFRSKRIRSNSYRKIPRVLNLSQDWSLGHVMGTFWNWWRFFLSCYQYFLICQLQKKTRIFLHWKPESLTKATATQSHLRPPTTRNNTQTTDLLWRP